MAIVDRETIGLEVVRRMIREMETGDAETALDGALRELAALGAERIERKELDYND